MNKKIDADQWFISYYNNKSETPFYAKIEYMLGDEHNTKAHRFPTYIEAYTWIENQVVMAGSVGVEPTK